MDGRNAFLSFHVNYLGKRADAIILTKAHKTLERLFFDGKSRQFTFQKFTDSLTETFTQLEQGGEGLTDLSKVRLLLDKTQCPAYHASVEMILGHEIWIDHYELALNHLKLVAHRLKLAASSNPKQRTISSTAIHDSRGRGGRGRSGGRQGRGGRGARGRGSGQRAHQHTSFNTSNPAVSYTAQAWRDMTAEQRTAVQTARTSRTDTRNTSSVTFADAPAPAPAANANTGSSMNRR